MRQFLFYFLNSTLFTVHSSLFTLHFSLITLHWCSSHIPAALLRSLAVCTQLSFRAERSEVEESLTTIRRTPMLNSVM